MPDHTLLTGATGLLGRYLLRDLLIAGQQVAVVVRPHVKYSVEHRIDSILRGFEDELQAPLPRPICFEGDLIAPLLGMNASDRQWVTRHCDSVIHNAASLSFIEEPNGEPYRSNVDGTRNMLGLCRDTKLRQLHYVSSAYVCGRRAGRILEDELDCEQTFRNDYERSKFIAESMVRNAACIEQLTVYRPAVIAGDSQTGYTSTYHGLFMYLRIMCLLAGSTEPGPDGVRKTEVELHLTGDEKRNIIPVDWTSAVICHLFETAAAHGHTFHLAPRIRMTPRKMIEAGYSYFNSTGVQFVGPRPLDDGFDNQLKRLAYENSTMYRDYEDHDPEFDTTNLERFASHLPCPEIDEAMLHRFMAFGERDRWGKGEEKKRRGDKTLLVDRRAS